MLALIIASAVALTNPATRTQIDQFVEHVRPVIAAQVKKVRPVIATEVAKMRMLGPNDRANAMKTQAPAPAPQYGPIVAPEPVRGPNGEYRIRVI